MDETGSELSNAPAISVVLCTYNRVDLFAEALQTLCDQTLDKRHYEIIVVDNNSTDRTRVVAEEFSRRYPNVHYCFESRQGISHARNLGIQKARGEYVGFCDDDCEIPKEWLTIASEIIESVSPGVFGGHYSAFYKSAKPRWYKDSYGSCDMGAQARALVKQEFVFGGNSFYRRSLLLSLGGFDPAMGHIGMRLGFGEDVAPQLLVRSQAPEEVIYYDPRLHVYHLVRPEKMSLRWVARERLTKGYYLYRLFSKGQVSVLPRRKLLGEAAYIAIKLLWDVTLGVTKRDRREYPFFQNYLYEHSGEYLKHLGRIYGKYKCIAKAGRTNTKRRLPSGDRTSGATMQDNNMSAEHSTSMRKQVGS